ncbi:hypothetical protein FG93_03470 [Bosea sp. LC85]|uniref:hypothetical protein n=1 Tax=Bosea sp. LC85 TaxID=1502851 RepID=UPI0004E29D7D|nr:hypothetical protein [Bosea sp. LC85]KFC69424.1 hypothetical protein FG93_03470 [Bosea sp. LC85]
MPRPPRMIKAGGDLLMAGLAIPAAGACRSPLFPAARLAGLAGHDHGSLPRTDRL